MKTLFSIIVLIFVFTLSSFAQTERDKGIEFYQQGKYERAIEVLQNALKEDETDGDAWKYLGMAYARIGKNGEAISALEKCQVIACKKSIFINDNYYDKKLMLITKPHPIYSAEGRGIKGIVRVVVDFGADGNKFVFPLDQLPGGLTESSVNAARNIEFEPAVKNGKPVSVIRFIFYHHN